MYLSEAITARAATDTGARDPDSLLGCLIFAEAGGTEKNLAKLIKSRSVADLLDKARAGQAGRVPAFNGQENRHEVIDFPSGILPQRWKRDLVALLLRPDGVLTHEVIQSLASNNASAEDAGKIVYQIKLELRPFSVGIESRRIDGSHTYRFKITGTSAWRMQKIIANGWAL